MQRDVLTDWPLWRIRLHACGLSEAHDDDILIYPKTAHVGPHPPESNQQQALAEVTGRLVAKYRETHELEWRRVKWVERAVRERVSELDEQRFVVVACFYTYYPEAY